MRPTFAQALAELAANRTLWVPVLIWFAVQLWKVIFPLFLHRKFVEELLSGHPLNAEHLRELLGHTPLQVAVGALVGFVGALLLNR